MRAELAGAALAGARALLQDEIAPALNVSGVELVQEDSADEEAWVSLGLVTQLLLLFTTLCIGHFLEKKRVMWIGEAAVALLLGMFVGVIVRYAYTDKKYDEVMSFQNDFFFLVLLPPIIFEAGFSLNVEPFVDNIGAICTFAFAGTFISTMSIGVMMWLAGKAGMCYGVTFLEATLFGAIVSATDPVTVLSVFQSLGANADLYSLVFGESVLNDAVAIVLYRTVMGFLAPDGGSAGIGSGILSFFIIFLGSTLCGIVVAIVSSVIFKTGYFQAENMLEPMLVILFAFSSYMMAEALKLSGIVSILFCGMVMAKYTRPNLSAHADLHAHGFFKILASMAETFVFIYIGTSLCLERQAWGLGLTWAFLVISLVALAASRALNVYPMAALINFMRPKDVAIPRTHMHMMWFSGLRGAIAFALSLSAAADLGEPGRVFLTTTFFIILFTVLFNGGLSAHMLAKLRLKGGPSGGVFTLRRYHSLMENEMVGVPKDWADDPSNGAGQAALDDVPLADPATANGDMSIHSNAVFSGAELDASQGQASGDSSARPLPPVARSGSIGEALSKSIVPGLKQMHEKVKEMNGASLSEKLSNIDKRYISKYLVAESSSVPVGVEPGSILRPTVSDSQLEDVELSIREPQGAAAAAAVGPPNTASLAGAHMSPAASTPAELSTSMAELGEMSRSAAGSPSEWDTSFSPSR
mmetsp:Transcript_5583/g.14202  ORF Transcript_5583/g.14202 Transcript_5583/m.14202 type:complete len:698 (-) Transcript_5583:324-2417(-)|eukprot:jgi/Tetstr1/447023/TSEL_034481.t1